VVARDHPRAAESTLEGDPNASPLALESVELVGHEGEAEPVVDVDRPLTVRLKLRARCDVDRAVVGVQLAREWHVLHGTRSNRQGISIRARAGERVTVELEYKSVSLMGGLYHLHVLLLESELARNPTLLVKRAAAFRVLQPLTEGVGLVRMAHTWRRVD